MVEIPTPYGAFELPVDPQLRAPLDAPRMEDTNTLKNSDVHLSVNAAGSGDDEAELARMGYKQELKCVINLTCLKFRISVIDQSHRRELGLLQVCIIHLPCLSLCKCIATLPELWRVIFHHQRDNGDSVVISIWLGKSDLVFFTTLLILT